MKLLRNLLSDRLRAFLALLGLSVAVVVLVGFAHTRIRADREDSSGPGPNSAKAILAVDKLVCSSCVADIRDALSGVDGVQQVFVDVAGGRAEVYFQQAVIQDTELIARTITEIGYPATLTSTLTPNEVRGEIERAKRMSRSYLASVGGQDIPKADLTFELAAVKAQYVNAYGKEVFRDENGRLLEQRLRVECMNRLIDQAAMLDQITRSGYFISEEAGERLYANYLERNQLDDEQLRKQLEGSGLSYAHFRKTIINQSHVLEYLKQEVWPSAAADDTQKRLADEWFRGARSAVKIVYYDRDLEQAIQDSLVSGSCDSSGSESCCSQ